jgi:hypothetical protein
MGIICKNKIWLERPIELLCSLNLIPLTNESIEKQLNSITRLIIIISIILYILGYEYSLLFLLLALLFIIILYYIYTCQQNNINKEKYKNIKINNEINKMNNYHKNNLNINNKCPVYDSFNYKNVPVSEYVKFTQNNNGISINKDQLIVNNPTTYRFCDDSVELKFNDPNYVSPNQRLVGNPNPKTNIAPVIIPPCYSLDYWKTNNLVDYSQINRESQQEAYQSGFFESTCCGYIPKNTYIKPESLNNPIYKLKDEYIKYDKHNNINYNEQFQHEYTPIIQDNTKYNNMDNINKLDKSSKLMWTGPPGEVNVACGYNPEQIFTSNLPSNYPASNCEKDSNLKNYNKNLFTQIIEPGIYSVNEINEPINSNIGISFTQQFEPTTCRRIDNDNIIYTEHDPRIIEPVIQRPSNPMRDPITEYNVYDPRHSGYGTSYRSYIDQQLGQPKFMYDDINAVRMPNYITRNNIDHTLYGDHYGTIPTGNEHGNQYNDNIKALANDSFLRNTTQFRTDIEERTMRKRNAEMWQNRMAPKRTGMTQYSAGSMSCK